MHSMEQTRHRGGSVAGLGQFVFQKWNIPHMIDLQLKIPFKFGAEIMKSTTE